MRSNSGSEIRHRGPLPLNVTDASATSTSNLVGQFDKLIYVILWPERVRIQGSRLSGQYIPT
jgi:hypothetical protein